MPEKSTLVIIDNDEVWDDEGYKVIVHWGIVDVASGQESLPRKVDEQFEKIKKEYLGWLYDLSQYKVNKSTLISHLKIFDNLSYWWLTKIAAKNSHTPEIFHIFKLRTLEKLYFERECYGLVYCGNDRILHNIFKDWCQKLGHPYRQTSTKKCDSRPQRKYVKWLASIFPFWFQAVLYLIKRWYECIRHAKPTHAKRRKLSSKTSQVTIVTYFPSIDMEKAGNGRFWSNYWGKLHDLLESSPYIVNWVWLYNESKQISYKDSVSLRDHCNSRSSDKYRHFIFDEFISPAVLLNCLKHFLKIYFKGLCLKDIRKEFHFPGSKLNFFPVLEFDWKSSFFGKDAVAKILDSSLCDYISKILPADPWGLYVWENQPWEISLVTAWERNQKQTKTIGYQHTVIPPQDTRYFFDPRVFQNKGNDTLPLPDKLALSGSCSESLMRENQYPCEHIVSVEALRFLYLRGRYETERKSLSQSDRVLLVATGGLEFETISQLTLLAEAGKLGGLKKYKRILIKSHPFLPINKYLNTLKFTFEFSIVSQPVAELWPIADVAYCANSSVVSLEAAYLGMPLIIMGATNNLNFNSLAWMLSVKYMVDPYMLCEALNNPQSLSIPEDILTFSETLCLWKKLLQIK
jgi:surface carbohydrate biosynthesis protein (TIGR04326 family)